MRILLITGGWSAERQVALNGAKALNEAMRFLGHEVEIFDLVSSYDGMLTRAQANDFAFINLHGSPGEDGVPQAMLESVGVPYQGSNARGSMLALNKNVAKNLFGLVGLRMAKSCLLVRKPGPEYVLPLKYPVFIKDVVGGSTLNMEYVASPEELHPALDRLFANAATFMAEEAISGYELTCGVTGELKDGVERPLALPPILIKPKSASGHFDYESKYSAGGAEEICPAPISVELTQKVQEMAVKAHNILGLRGYSRADFIVPEDGEPYILEVNTLPGMTGTSLIPQEFAAIGISFAGMTERLIQLGLAAKK